ncbi:TNF receptor-associated factor 3 isoform X2 [Rhipicephalus sanguineus]|uniref:TNF receptor-associated factor 3 isoform X2 n=1 Tax=Rhipicephalus sanguineus TaxID=34632 RepID=UPI0020C2521B|nr:TNF receptor-associated factor 3 isoform X2 [Rhipicephalus sanguineus]
MPDLRRVHRFRDHPIAGVNWRPIHFVDEVHSSRVCGLCRMIPKRTVLLPCDHALCHSCHAASLQGCGGRCPLDQEPFEESECTSCDFPTRKADALKVHCWNEVHGCKFTGVMKLMLRHYENECTFHAVECLRCGEQVLHRELSTHYVAGCNAAVSSPRAGNASSDSQALTLQDCTAAFEELKMLLRDGSHEHLLLAIQSQMNGLIEQIRHQESKLAVITRAVAAPSASEMAQVEASSSRTSLQAGTSEQNPTEKASTSSTSRSCSEETLMSRQLVPLVDLPREVLQSMRKTSSNDYPQHVVTQIFPGVRCHLDLARPLSTTVTWTEVLGSVRYVLSLFDARTSVTSYEWKFVDVTVLHTRDAYFTVEVYERKFCTFVRIKFHGRAGASRCPAPAFRVKMYSPLAPDTVLMNSVQEPCDRKHYRDSWIHCCRRYTVCADDLIRLGFLRSGTINFEIELWRQ